MMIKLRIKAFEHWNDIFRKDEKFGGGRERNENHFGDHFSLAGKKKNKEGSMVMKKEEIE